MLSWSAKFSETFLLWPRLPPEQKPHGDEAAPQQGALPARVMQKYKDDATDSAHLNRWEKTEK